MHFEFFIFFGTILKLNAGSLGNIVMPLVYLFYNLCIPKPVKALFNVGNSFSALFCHFTLTRTEFLLCFHIFLLSKLNFQQPYFFKFPETQFWCVSCSLRTT